MNLLLSWMALAAAESAGTVRSLEFDVPEAAWQWAAIAVGSIVLLTIVIALHDVVLDQVLADPTGRLSMGDAYVAALRTTRDLLS